MWQFGLGRRVKVEMWHAPMCKWVDKSQWYSACRDRSRFRVLLQSSTLCVKALKKTLENHFIYIYIYMRLGNLCCSTASVLLFPHPLDRI